MNPLKVILRQIFSKDSIRPFQLQKLFYCVIYETKVADKQIPSLGNGKIQLNRVNLNFRIFTNFNRQNNDMNQLPSKLDKLSDGKFKLEYRDKLINFHFSQKNQESGNGRLLLEFLQMWMIKWPITSYKIIMLDAKSCSKIKLKSPLLYKMVGSSFTILEVGHLSQLYSISKNRNVLYESTDIYASMQAAKNSIPDLLRSSLGLEDEVSSISCQLSGSNDADQNGNVTCTVYWGFGSLCPEGRDTAFFS